MCEMLTLAATLFFGRYAVLDGPTLPIVAEGDEEPNVSNCTHPSPCSRGKFSPLLLGEAVKMMFVFGPSMWEIPVLYLLLLGPHFILFYLRVPQAQFISLYWQACPKFPAA